MSLFLCGSLIGFTMDSYGWRLLAHRGGVDTAG